MTTEQEIITTTEVTPQEHVKVLDHKWEQQLPIFENIHALGTAKYVSTLYNLEEAFITDNIIRCIDEGTPKGIHSAGSYILHPFMTAFNKVNDTQAQGITSHENCGAAKIAFDNLPQNDQLKYGNSDNYGKIWARQLAIATNIEYMGHIHDGDMKRPNEGHIARVVYYDGTGSFDYSQTEGLPPGFTISRRHVGQEQSFSETEVSIAIALGDHGFGSRITSEQRLYIIPIGDPDSSAHSVDSLTIELQQFANNYEGKVVISGFTKPSTI